MSDDEMKRRLDTIEASLVDVDAAQLRKSLTALGSLMMMAGFSDEIDAEMHRSMKECSLTMMCSLSAETAKAMMALLLYMTGRSHKLRDPSPEAIAEAKERFGVDISNLVRDMKAGDFDSAGGKVADIAQSKIDTAKRAWNWEEGKPDVGG